MAVVEHLFIHTQRALVGAGVGAAGRDARRRGDRHRVRRTRTGRARDPGRPDAELRFGAVAAERLERALDRDDITDRGVEVKGIAQKLLDFPALRNGQEAYLCWRQGDDRVEWWIDTFDNRRFGYWFQIGAGGSRGDALIGASVVGAGLPQVSSEQQLIQQDFESMEMDGFDYAFRFPGLIRVKQSAGRVIRGEEDRGVVVLLERRFAQPAYAQYLPRWWQPQYCNDLGALQQALASFWESQKELSATPSSAGPAPESS